MNIYLCNLPQRSFEHTLDQVASCLRAELRVKYLLLRSGQRQTNAPITLAGGTVDLL
jgi:hypothetical protein